MAVAERVNNVAAVSITTEAAVIAAVTGRTRTIKSANLSSTVAGVVVFRDGTAGTIIASVYFAANTPRSLGADVFGANGKRLTASNALTAELASASLSGQIVTVDED